MKSHLDAIRFSILDISHICNQITQIAYQITLMVTGYTEGLNVMSVYNS